MFDALNDVRPRCFSFVIDYSNAALMSTTVVPDDNSTAVIPASFAMTFLWERQLVYWAAFPQMIVDRPSQMSNTGGTRRVLSEVDSRVPTSRRGSKCDTRVKGRARRFSGRWRVGMLLGTGRVGTRGEGRQKSERETNASEGNPRLKHRGWYALERADPL
jgi:hypothetical protein